MFPIGDMVSWQYFFNYFQNKLDRKVYHFTGQLIGGKIYNESLMKLIEQVS